MRMAHIRPPIVDRFGKVWHETLDPILHEPLAEHWTLILKRLNAEKEPEEVTLELVAIGQGYHLQSLSELLLGS